MWTYKEKAKDMAVKMGSSKDRKPSSYFAQNGCCNCKHLFSGGYCDEPENFCTWGYSAGQIKKMWRKGLLPARRVKLYGICAQWTLAEGAMSAFLHPKGCPCGLCDGSGRAPGALFCAMTSA